MVSAYQAISSSFWHSCFNQIFEVCDVQVSHNLGWFSVIYPYTKMEMNNTIINSFLLFFQEESVAQARLSSVESYKTYRQIKCGTCATAGEHW